MEMFDDKNDDDGPKLGVASSGRSGKMTERGPKERSRAGVVGGVGSWGGRTKTGTLRRSGERDTYSELNRWMEVVMIET